MLWQELHIPYEVGGSRRLACIDSSCSSRESGFRDSRLGVEIALNGH